MLIGEYIHSLDKKKRVSIPAKMRRELGETVIITRGLDKCLFIYPVEEWKVLAKKLSELSIGQVRTRQFVRLMLAGAYDAEVDALGRILIPDHLKEYAELKSKVVITGVFARAEIWDQEKWNEYRGSVEERADQIAQELGEEGLY